MLAGRQLNVTAVLNFRFLVRSAIAAKITGGAEKMYSSP